MPETTATVPAMTGEQGYNVLFNDVYAPAFFHKLAQDYGIRPATPEHASRVLKMAGQLRNLNDTQAVAKQAAAVDPLSRAEAILARQMKSAGYVAPEDNVSKIAQELSQNPQLAAAALAYQNHYAQQASA